MLIPEASNSARHVDTSLNYILGIEVVLLSIVTVAMVLFVVRYNRKKNPKPEDIEGSTSLEILWTAIPTVLVLIMFYIGWRSFDYIRKVPAEAMAVKVVARQWSWLFEYADGKQSNIVRVPLGRPVKLVLTSQDVNHCLHIPAFRIKEDCVPGMETYLTFVPKEIGAFDIFCTELCGVGHSGMISKVVVMEGEDFEAWYAAAVTEKISGLKLLEEKGCLGCHSVDGTKKIGPTFKGIFGRQEVVMTGGKERTITVDEEYLRRSMLQPQADIVKDFPPIMPAVPLTKEELAAIVEYIKTLK